VTSAELTIGEVAGRTGLTRHTLRYYERDGLMLGVDRGGSGHRRYSERDLTCESPDSYLSSSRPEAASVPR
jgi:hypothetical protein